MSPIVKAGNVGSVADKWTCVENRTTGSLGFKEKLPADYVFDETTTTQEIALRLLYSDKTSE